MRIEAFSFVRAWVDIAQGQTVTLLLNNAPYWTGLPIRLEHPGFDPLNPRRPCGLWTVLPAPSRSPEIVQLALIAGEATLAVAQVDLAQRYHGFVDKIEVGREGLLVEGWAHDIGRSLDPVKLQLCKQGTIVSSFVAAKSREDLKRDKIGLGNHAFSEVVRNPSAKDTRLDDLRVVIAGTEIALVPSDNLIRSLHGTPVSVDATLGAVEAAQISLDIIPAGTPDALIAGVCDKISEEEVLGWALDLQNKDTPVVLDLLINNFVVATTRTDRFRSDIAEKHKCAGFVGFHFEIIPQMRLGHRLNIAVVSRKTGAILPQGLKTILPGFRLSLPAAASSDKLSLQARDRLLSRFVTPKPRVASVARSKYIAPSVALIVLNRNGAALLDRHFKTFALHNTYKDVQHVIVDHASIDNSREIVQRWQALGLRITLVERNDNYSFSASNNYAVQFTDADILVFCNNDIFFTHDSLPPFVEALENQDVGIAGIKLIDESQTGEDFSAPIVQHLGVFYNTAKYDRVVHPVEARYLPLLEPYLGGNFKVPAVTGAFLGAHRKDFLAVNGFCEEYFYGYEDIDLCLKVQFELQKSVILVGRTEALHYRGYSRKKTGLWGGTRMRQNSQLLSSRFGLALRRLLRVRSLKDHQFWTATRPIIAFAVTEAGASTTAGDFYTAYELATELVKLIDATIVFLEEKTNWYELKDIDLLVAMTHNYDLSLVQHAKQNLIAVGWARNWFTDWAHPRDDNFDIILASSTKGAAAIRAGTGYQERVLRIGTNRDRFFHGPADAKAVDCVFTSSFWGHARDMMYYLEPAALPFSFELYGYGWDQVPSLAPYSRGFVKYDDLPAIYRRARVVIDDANSVTKEWGSVNSRVFDALSAGALVVTNSPEASRDGFDGELPCFESREELEALLRLYCGDESRRLEKLDRLQAIVSERHGYGVRAQQFVAAVTTAVEQMFRIAIKVPCPSPTESHLWGDYHFAQSLARELRALGHSVRLDMLDRWYHANRLRDDVVICLRGLGAYVPTPDQMNICWMISHPDTASLKELRAYDRIYVASHKHTGWLMEQGLSGVETMLQCVDTDLFSGTMQSEASKEFDVLFVGNSRNVMRPVVRDAIAIDAPLTVIGSGWDGLIPSRYILQSSVPYLELPQTYSKSRVLLNDHWSSMAKSGFISNRLFDCVAAGSYIISDRVDGLSDVFGSLVNQYDTLDEFKRFVAEGLNGAGRHSDKELSAEVSRANSFRARAVVLSDFIRNNYEDICLKRLAEPKD